MSVDGKPDQVSAIVNGEIPKITDISEIEAGTLYYAIVKKQNQDIQRTLGLVYGNVITDYAGNGYELVFAFTPFYAPNDIVSTL
jgi:hypothetical protein